MKTRDEVEALKYNWSGDPIWDLENTEGFEEYHDELLKYSIEMKNHWDVAYQKKPGGLIESALLNLDRAKDDRVCQLAEMHLMMAQTEALIAIAKLLERTIMAIENHP